MGSGRVDEGDVECGGAIAVGMVCSKTRISSVTAVEDHFAVRDVDDVVSLMFVSRCFAVLCKVLHALLADCG